MKDLETLLEPLIESAPEPPPISLVHARATRLRRRRRARSGGIALALVALIVTGVTLAVPRNRGGIRTIAPATTSARPLHVGTPQPIRTSNVDMIASAGSIWISRPNQVVRLDATDGRVTATIAVPGASDHRTLAAGAGSIWVQDTGTARLTRIDSGTNRVVATIPLASGDLVPVDVAFLDGRVWVARLEPTGTEGDVVVVDPATNAIAGHAAIPRTFGFVAGSDALWYVADNRSGFTRLDPRTLQTRTARRDVIAIVGAGAGHLWLQVDAGVIEVDERSGARIGPVIRTVGRVNVTAITDDGVVWVASQRDSSTPGSVTPYDAVSHRPLGRAIPIGLPVLRLAVTPGALWVAGYPSAGLARVPYTR